MADAPSSLSQDRDPAGGDIHHVSRPPGFTLRFAGGALDIEADEEVLGARPSTQHGASQLVEGPDVEDAQHQPVSCAVAEPVGAPDEKEVPPLLSAGTVDSEARETLLPSTQHGATERTEEPCISPHMRHVGRTLSEPERVLLLHAEFLSSSGSDDADVLRHQRTEGELRQSTDPVVENVDGEAVHSSTDASQPDNDRSPFAGDTAQLVSIVAQLIAQMSSTQDKGKEDFGAEDLEALERVDRLIELLASQHSADPRIIELFQEIQKDNAARRTHSNQNKHIHNNISNNDKSASGINNDNNTKNTNNKNDSQDENQSDSSSDTNNGTARFGGGRNSGIPISLRHSAQTRQVELQAVEPSFCFICFDEIVRIAPLRPGHSPDCHRNLCDGCLHDQLQWNIRNADVERLECPSCYWPITLREIEALCTPEDVVKYHKFLFERYISSQKHLKRCGLPGCENAVIGEQECSLKDWHCGQCAVQCPFCKAPTHAAGQECDGYRRYYKAERGYNRFALFSLGSKRCPKCRILIIKNKGCPHMTCKSCGHQFCWKCKGDWKTHDTCRITKIVCVNEKVTDSPLDWHPYGSPSWLQQLWVWAQSSSAICR